MRRLLTLVAAALPVLAAAEATTWTIDPSHSESSFAVKHLVISTVRGHFGKTTGTIAYDDQDFSNSKVDVTIDATSVDTRVEKRDAHLKSPDFFDVAKYPTITFKSTKIEKTGENTVRVTGDLTIKGVTKPTVWNVIYTPKSIVGMGGEERRGFSGSSKINRRDFGLNWNKTVEAGPVVGDEVNVFIEAEAVKDKPKANAG